MNKKIFFTLSLLSILVFLSGCGGGGGGGNLSTPPASDVGVPSIVRLLPAKFVAHTNSFITLSVKVLDGRGVGLPDRTVYFENMSSTGVLSAPSAITNSNGIAEVAIGSSTEGFASILVAVNNGSGSGQVRDVKTVFFTSALSLNLAPTMELDVDGNDSNTIYNEPGDYNLFEPSVANDTQVTIRATVSNNIGLRASGVPVTFGSDFPFRIGSDPAVACSDGSEICEVSFPLGNTATTDFNGEAFVLVQVTPTVLRSITTVLNITATANNGAFNMVSLFLNPVTVSTVSVSANPTTVASAGKSTITAAVTTSAGTPVPDGTTVTFTASGGGALDTPFAQTEGGVAEAELTAPTVTSDTTVSVTASAGGKSGSTSVTVKAPTVTPPAPAALAVGPALAIVNGTAGAKQTFIASGGTGPYIATYVCVGALICNSTDADCADGPATDPEFWNTTGSFVVTVPPSSPADTCILTVTDFVGDTVTATLQIN